MAINFGNVNISLQQFQEISSGKYNAGEVHVDQANTVMRGLAQGEHLAITPLMIASPVQPENGKKPDVVNINEV